MAASPAIIGFGITGQSVARYLLSKGQAPTVLDTRGARTEAVDFDLEYHWDCATWPERVLGQTSEVFVSPGLPPAHPLLQQAHEAQLPVYSDIDLFMRAVPGKVLGVTGTNGKSTVVSLIGHLLNAQGYRCKVGGNLGTPALDLLNEDADFYVLELSSFQLAHSGELPFARACILNISDDHLDYHGSAEAYCEAKQRVYAAAKHCVSNRDDPRTRPSSGRESITFGVGPGIAPLDLSLAKADGEDWIVQGEKMLHAASRLPVPGRHNAINCMAALAMVQPWFESDRLGEALMGFAGLPHRFALVAERNQVAFINDSKATNVGSTLAALGSLPADNQVVLIVGGDGKGARLDALLPAMRGRIHSLVALGKDGEQFRPLAAALERPFYDVAAMEAAVERAAAVAPSPGIVLLSPACASTDMFANFEARGEAFENAVASLALPAMSGD
ncbi:MAG: UDP-N-acetylmuramoyl-L-alanine--D-glutamate ligase [Gammaproteobacteria bacterium TMED134]|nr:MAG: UDP-N-acetylmuramoyl-L-alanine--D-glutamate ligase [Gammaproteobacteria bacterium TMED134]